MLRCAAEQSGIEMIAYDFIASKIYLPLKGDSELNEIYEILPLSFFF